MKREDAEREMTEGYRDGFEPGTPEPSDNRSLSYRHGFRNGRADRNYAERTHQVDNRGYADDLRRIAEECILADVNPYTY